MRTCRNCGQVTVMMCQLETGFCSANCEDQYAENIQTVYLAGVGAFRYRSPMQPSDWVDA